MSKVYKFFEWSSYKCSIREKKFRTLNINEFSSQDRFSFGSRRPPSRPLFSQVFFHVLCQKNSDLGHYMLRAHLDNLFVYILKNMWYSNVSLYIVDLIQVYIYCLMYFHEIIQLNPRVACTPWNKVIFHFQVSVQVLNSLLI